ncbi:hypothetical protein LCGC14_1850890 [marine sediment metagenome]|uniref:Uncharacterized protein n=1 Tax=marine sediment metagenome TaxID=412755 RepID=A0A0F9GAC9_9ZZZZ
MSDEKEVKVYLGKESFEHRKEMEENRSPENQAIFWMNKGREETLKELNNRIKFLEGRILELENKIVKILEEN